MFVTILVPLLRHRKNRVGKKKGEFGLWSILMTLAGFSKDTETYLRLLRNWEDNIGVVQYMWNQEDTETQKLLCNLAKTVRLGR